MRKSITIKELNEIYKKLMQKFVNIFKNTVKAECVRLSTPCCVINFYALINEYII